MSVYLLVGGLEPDTLYLWQQFWAADDAACAHHGDPVTASITEDPIRADFSGHQNAAAFY